MSGGEQSSIQKSIQYSTHYSAQYSIQCSIQYRQYSIQYSIQYNTQYNTQCGTQYRTQYIIQYSTQKSIQYSTLNNKYQLTFHHQGFARRISGFKPDFWIPAVASALVPLLSTERLETADFTSNTPSSTAKPDFRIPAVASALVPPPLTERFETAAFTSKYTLAHSQAGFPYSRRRLGPSTSPINRTIRNSRFRFQVHPRPQPSRIS